MTKQANNNPSDPIADERRQMVARLHRSYLNLVKEMAPLQAEWDAGPQAAFARAAAAGWQLGASWRDADANEFDAAFWNNIAPIAAMEVSSPSSDTSMSPAERLLRMRDQVLALPSLLAAGDRAAITTQLGVVLRNFDAAYADEILGDEDFGPILDLIQHDESVLSYMAYVGLLITSVPPNFYAFVAGKGAPCLLLEAIVLAVCALVSGSNATAARIWEIEERLDELEVEDTPASEALNIDDAADALIRMLDDLRRAADDVHELCSDKSEAQQAGVAGQTSITEKMAAIVADTSCRDCGSSKHTTALFRMGTVRYE